MFRVSDDARVIARAIYEDRWPSQDIYGWITKYYAQLVMLKEAEVSMSNVMRFLDVDEEDGRLVGDISGVEYSDVKAGKNIYYAMEFPEYEEYTAMYVPD